ncbi:MULTISPECIES: transposase domain-containing protein [unclassified Streptomyces]|uniref:transposase domain-containing protein n=1 Tax=unclassified Streptomyces TaxID=2593676 RepID=UPI003D8DA5E0
MAAGRFTPGHLGELTAIVPFGLVDALLSETRTVQRRMRDLPSRVGASSLLATCLFPRVGYRLVWDKLAAGLSGLPAGRLSEQGSRCVTCAGDSVERRCGRCSKRWPDRLPTQGRRDAVRPVPNGVVRRLQFAEDPRLRAEPFLAGEDRPPW